MPKKRTTPPVNPLKQDLVASVVAEPAPTPKARQAEALPEPPPQKAQEPPRAIERPAAGEGSRRRRSPANGRGSGAQKSGRRGPQSEKRNTKWTEKDVQLKARVRQADLEVIRAMVERLGEKTDSNPSEANVARALWSLFMLIDEELDDLPPTSLHKPGYADKRKTAIYEDELAKILLKCFRKVRMIGPDRSGPIDRDQT